MFDKQSTVEVSGIMPARKKHPEERLVPLNVSVSPQTRQILMELAQAADRSVAEVVRACLQIGITGILNEARRMARESSAN